MNEFERLAILTAMKKELEAELAKVRAEVEDALIKEPRSFKEGKDILIGMDEVGHVSHQWTREAKSLRCTDVEAFAEWLYTDGMPYFEQFMGSKASQRLLDACASALIVDGEIPAGCKVVEVPSVYIGIRVTGCDPNVVKGAIGGALPFSEMPLLGGADGR